MKMKNNKKILILHVSLRKNRNNMRKIEKGKMGEGRRKRRHEIIIKEIKKR